MVEPMSFVELLQYTFKYGTGVSFGEAIQTDRYKEILRASTPGKIVGADDKALMIYLGELITERAASNLPFEMKLQAIVWQELGSKARVDALRHSINAFSISKTETVATESPEVKLNSALPEQQTMWELADKKPNCLGVAQMLVGFARMAGARCAVVDTIGRHDVRYHYDMSRNYAALYAMLDKHRSIPAVRRVQRSCRSFLRQSMKSILYFESFDQAHHGLSIAIDDSGGRALFDPYMGKCLSLEPDTEKMWLRDEYPESMEERVVETFEVEEKVSFEGTTHFLDSLLDIYEDLYGATYNNFDYPGLTQLIRTAVKVVESRHSKVRKAYKDTSGEYIDDLKKPCEYVSVLRKVYGAFVRANPNELTMLSDAQFMGELPAALSKRMTKRDRDRAFNRFVGFVLEEEINTTYALYNPDQVHPCIESGYPEYHIAVMTLNHVAYVTGSDNTSLLQFDPFSQVLIHDTISAVRQSDDELLKQTMDASLTSLSVFPDNALDPRLMPYIQEKESPMTDYTPEMKREGARAMARVALESLSPEQVKDIHPELSEAVDELITEAEVPSQQKDVAPRGHGPSAPRATPFMKL